MALGGETSYMRKQMREDPGGYGKAFLIVIIIGIALLIAFLFVDDDDAETSKQAEPSTTSVLDSGNVVNNNQSYAKDAEEAIERENQEAYEEYMRQQAEEYMKRQPEEDDGLQDSRIEIYTL